MNLNVHFHMLLLDGVYVADGDSVRWVPVPPPTTEEVQEVVTQIAWTVERWLGRRATPPMNRAKRTRTTTPTAYFCRPRSPGGLLSAFVPVRRCATSSGQARDRFGCRRCVPRTKATICTLRW